MKTTLYTIGHSTHPIDEFIKMLKNYKVEMVVGVFVAWAIVLLIANIAIVLVFAVFYLMYLRRK